MGLILAAYRLLHTANWRRIPATSSQKAFIAKRLKISPEDGELEQDVPLPEGDSRRRVNLKTLTKGQATDIIARLKHGGLVRRFFFPFSLPAIFEEGGINGCYIIRPDMRKRSGRSRRRRWRWKKRG